MINFEKKRTGVPKLILPLFALFPITRLSLQLLDFISFLDLFR